MLKVMSFIFVIYCVVGEELSPDDQAAIDYTGIMVKCMEENKVDPKELESLTSAEMPDNDKVKCLFACTYKYSGMMDDKGMLIPEGVMNATMKYYANDQEKIKQTKEFINACMSVNDAAVTDGDKGCDRAALIFICTTENEFNILSDQ